MGGLGGPVTKRHLTIVRVAQLTHNNELLFNVGGGNTQFPCEVFYFRPE